MPATVTYIYVDLWLAGFTRRTDLLPETTRSLEYFDQWSTTSQSEKKNQAEEGESVTRDYSVTQNTFFV